MKHVKALLIKFVATLALLYIILGLMYDMTFGEIFLISAVLGVAAYIIGDMLILPRTNNVIAAIADFGLAWLIIYQLTDAMTVNDNVFTASLLAAIGVALVEVLFHRYLATNILPNKGNNNGAKRNLQYQTEISDEFGNGQVNNKDENNMDK